MATGLAFARILGEYGATIVLAGNIQNETTTLSIALMNAMDASQSTLLDLIRNNLEFRMLFYCSLLLSLLTIIFISTFRIIFKRWLSQMQVKTS